MLKPEELLQRELWTVVLSKLSTKDELSCRCVCNSFKKEVDSILKNNQDRLWLRLQDADYEHCFCYDKDHRISSRDTLYFDDGIVSIKNLEFVSQLMPSLKILQLDPLNLHCYSEDIWIAEATGDWNFPTDLPEYRHKWNKAVPITKIFPQVACLILPGQTETDNFVGHLSQVEHLTLFDYVLEGLPKFPNLVSLEMQIYRNRDNKHHLPMPFKRFVMPDESIKWSSLPKTLEVIETDLDCGEYISLGKPYFSNLKVLKGLDVRRNENLETPINFLKDHKGSLTELSFSVEKDLGNIKVLVPLFTHLQKLSVQIKTDKQAIELKEIKALAYNLQYFELLFVMWSSTNENFSAILENLPTGLDNLSIKNVTSYKDINPVMEKIMEKVVSGDTKRVTIAEVDESHTTTIIENIVKMKPEPVIVEVKNSRIVGNNNMAYFSLGCDIVISL